MSEAKTVRTILNEKRRIVYGKIYEVNRKLHTMGGIEAGKVPQRQYAPANSRLPTKLPLIGLGCSSFSSFFSSQNEEALTVDTISRDHVAVKGWVETIR